MFGLLIAGVAGVFGHLKSRTFVGQKLRYTTVVEKPALGLWAGVGVGVGAMVALSPIVWVLPFVGAGTAIAIGTGVGVGVGTGVTLGVMDTKDPPKLLDD